jgi:glycosyltransferase involved in cell wall biosynthesis
VRGQVQLFIQNRLLIEPHLEKSLHFKTKLRVLVERTFLRFGCKRVSRFIVQTASMSRLLQETLAIDPTKICVSPFIPASRLTNAQPHRDRSATQKKLAEVGLDFIYPASGESYKNHRTLIDAWCILASDGIRPSLAVTVDTERYSKLCEHLSAQCSHFNLRIQNLGFISSDAIAHAISNAGAIIYPSLTESFGIPLAEAHVRGKPIIASELDFVRDVCVPNETFDPNSAVSIARAVKRFLGLADTPRLPECDANEFLEQIVSSAGGYVRSTPC